MPFSCEFDSSFSSAFAICPPGDQPDTRYLRGVPALKTRRRAEIQDISGVGYVPVIAVAQPTGEAKLKAEALIAVEAFGNLVSEVIRLATAAIRAGAEAVLSGEWAVGTWTNILPRVRAALTGEYGITSSAAIAPEVMARLQRDGLSSGTLAIRASAEALVTSMENEEAILLAGGMYLLTNGFD